MPQSGNSWVGVGVGGVEDVEFISTWWCVELCSPRDVSKSYPLVPMSVTSLGKRVFTQ